MNSRIEKELMYSRKEKQVYNRKDKRVYSRIDKELVYSGPERKLVHSRGTSTRRSYSTVVL